MVPISTSGARPLDTSEHRPVYLLPVSGGSYLRISASAYRLLQEVEAGASFEALAARSRNASGASVSAEQVAGAYQQIVDRVDRVERAGLRLTGGFWGRVTLLPAGMVGRLARVGALAYRPAVVAVLGIAVLLAGVAAVGQQALHLSIAGDGFWVGYLLLLGSLVAHELGHASACAYFGARPSEIGFVLYLIYPSFYSNVSAAWTLTRRQRIAVDLGGIYFQLMFAAGLVGVHAVWPAPALRVALALIAGSCLLSINPLLKFDGYWLLADALGVTNLRQQALRLIARLVRRLGRRSEPAPALPWPPRVTALLVVYTVLSLALMGWFLWVLVPAVARVAAAFPMRVAEVAAPVAQGQWPAGGKLGALASASFLLLFAGIMIGRLVRQLWTVAPRRGAQGP